MSPVRPLSAGYSRFDTGLLRGVTTPLSLFPLSKQSAYHFCLKELFGEGVRG